MPTFIEFLMLSLIFTVPLRFLVRASQPATEKPCGWCQAFVMSTIAVGVGMLVAPL